MKKLRQFLPYRKYTLHTQLSLPETIARLEAAKDRNKRAVMPELQTLAQHVYEGDISETAFELQRVIGHRNALLPVVKGKIVPAEGGTTLQITMRPAGYVRVFMAVWFGALGIIFLLLLWAEIAGLVSGRGFSGTFFVPLGMMVFGLLLAHFGFSDESESSELFFRKLLFQ